MTWKQKLSILSIFWVLQETDYKISYQEKYTTTLEFNKSMKMNFHDGLKLGNIATKGDIA